MKRLVACVCILVAGLSCELVRQAKPPTKAVQRADGLVVFLTGNELGELKPCGCSGGQLGGLDRRTAIFSTVPRQSRLIVDIGSLVAGDGEQDLIKLNTIIRAFDALGYDVVNLTAKDIETVKNIGLLNSIGSVLSVITAEQAGDANIPTQVTRRLPLKGRSVAVTVAAFDPQSAPMAQIQEVFPRPVGVRTVNILILTHCDAATIESIAKSAPGVDCVVCPADSDEPRLWGGPDARPLALSVGRYGRYICRLQITEAAEDKDKLELNFQEIPLTEDLPEEPSLVRLYKDYQQQVKESKLLEKYWRFSLAGDAKYIGSESCKACHLQEYEQWRTTTHARAYATLEKVGSQFDPECVICHVVGMEYESGFVSEEQTGHLKNVGCENCHGPGSEHVRTPETVKTTGPTSSCLDCHTPEKSTDYAGKEQLYLEKIVHW